MKLSLKLFLFCSLTISQILFGQKQELTYFLPDIDYNKKVPTPEAFFGHQIGEWHLSYDKLSAYCKVLSETSDRVEYTEYAKSHENRPLLYLTISTPANLKNKESIRQKHLDIADVSKSGNLNLNDMPLVIYQGYSIHGNEPSGGNASALVAYYLAAGISPDIDKLLANTIVMLDPCYNPDGFNRFSSWANTHKGMNLISDPSSREFNEMWPGGRTNHYWFDLNRDWLLLVHPESRGRINTFQNWLPNILTDHHEMGSNSTFFFQPGVPSRTNPNTPPQNQALTEEIATYHGKALDKIGSQYFTKKSFDDFYYGKGSTYPDIHGSVGILFEQASSRGHLQETVNGPLSFAFTIRNQVVTSLSTQAAATAMRVKLLEYQRRFYQDMNDKAKKSTIKGYVYTDVDVAKISKFNSILVAHKIEIQKISKEANIGGKPFKANESYYVSMDQRQYGLVKTIFEKVTTYEDSLFYDVSAWTLPLAFDLTFAEVNATDVAKVSTDSKNGEVTKAGKVVGVDKPYAYVFQWDQLHSARMLYRIQKAGLITKMSTIELKLPFDGKTKIFDPSSVIIPVMNQTQTPEQIKTLIDKEAMFNEIDVFAVATGMGTDAVSIGDPGVSILELPKPFTIIGDGVSSYDAGELWFFMDQSMQIPMPMIDKKDLSRADLSKYNTLILVDGSYSDISDSNTKRLDDWIKGGGTVLAMKGAQSWLKSKGLISLKSKEMPKNDNPALTYLGLEAASGSKGIGGSIFSSKIDLGNPLAYGYKDDEIPMFREGTSFNEITANPLATPVKYAAQPLHSGYVPRGLTSQAANTAAVTVFGGGRGKMICFNDNVLFRGYWYATHRLFTNAMFLSDLISGGAVER